MKTWNVMKSIKTSKIKFENDELKNVWNLSNKVLKTKLSSNFVSCKLLLFFEN